LSETSREVVASSYEAWRARDADAATRLCHADVQLHLDDQTTVYRGHRGIREDRLVYRGAEILGLATFRGRRHGSGIEVEHFIGRGPSTPVCSSGSRSSTTAVARWVRSRNEFRTPLA
jgi:hypothetical protein